MIQWSSPGAAKPVQLARIEVGDARPFLLQPQRQAGGLGQRRRLGLVAGHAGAGAGEAFQPVEVVGGAAAILARLQHRIAAGDVGSLGQAGEGALGAGVADLPAGEDPEGVMHLVPRQSGGDAVDMGLGHGGERWGRERRVHPVGRAPDWTGR